MSLFSRWLPNTLFSRVFILYSASLFVFTCAGLGLFYYHQFTERIDDAFESGHVLVEVLAPTLSDSVVIGDYDTVKRSLARAATGRSISYAEFIDIAGVRIRADNPTLAASTAPQWLEAGVANHLFDINRVIVVGAKDYGIVRLGFSAQVIAQEIWQITKLALVVALLCLLPGQVLIWWPLRRIAHDLAETARFAGSLGQARSGQLKVASSIVETQRLAEALNRVAADLHSQFQALTESESRKGAILSAGLDCFITIDTSGRIVDFNKAAEQTFGYRADEVHGRSLSELIIPPEFRNAHTHGIERWNQTGEGPVLHQRLEITAMRRSGEIFPVELAVVPFGSSDHQYFAGFIRDISERKALEKERQNLESSQRQMVNDLAAKQFAIDQHAIVSITTPDGNIIYANDRLQALSGYSARELVGQNHRMLKSGLQDEAFYRTLWHTIRRGEVWHGEYANRRKDGEIYWVAATIVPMLDEDGRPNQYISIQTDITYQKRTEHALAEARRRELTTGAEIQRSLLLGDLPWGIHGTTLATYTEPSQGIDGDFFAITRFRPDCFEVLVGDVMGKGVPAALIGAAVKSTYNKVLAELFSHRASQIELPTPAEIVNALHAALTSRLIELNAFVTLVLYRIDNKEHTLQVVNAGHTPGLVVRGTEAACIEEVLGDNLPVGVVPEEVYTQRTLIIAPGDALLIYSDGITETGNAAGEEFGQNRLIDLLRTGKRVGLPPDTLLQFVRQQVRQFAGSDQLDDDQTAIMIDLHAQRTGPRGSVRDRVHPSVFTLPWRLDGLAPLRTRIAEAAWCMPAADIDAMTLACFEAATNILRHARPYFQDATITCRLEQRPEEFAVELIYPGPKFTPPDELTPDFSGNSEGGFGLYIIEQSVDEVVYSSLVPGISCIRLVKRPRSSVAAGESGP